MNEIYHLHFRLSAVIYNLSIVKLLLVIAIYEYEGPVRTLF